MEDKIAENILIANSDLLIEKEYWVDKLAGLSTINRFPADAKEEVSEENKNTEFNFCISNEIYNELNRISKGTDQGILIILLSAVQFLLYQYTGNQDIIIGTPIFKQESPGKYLNDLLPIRTFVTGEMTFKDLLFEVKNTLVKVNENLNFPIHQVIESLQFSNIKDKFCLFKTLVSLNNIQEFINMDSFPSDMFFSFEKTSGQLEGLIIYDSNRFNQDTIKRITKQLENFLKMVIPNPLKKLKNIQVMSEDEKRLVLESLNQLEVDFPLDKTIVDLYLEQVEKSPHSIALSTNKTEKNKRVQISYLKSHQESNQIANMLELKGVLINSIVAIIAERSIDTILGILGILKAGAIYLPMDPKYPLQRIKLILEDSHATFVLVNRTNIKSNKWFRTIQTRKVSNFQPLITVPRPPIADFDGLPFPDRSMVNYEKYNRYIGLALVKDTVSIQGTRGCPYKCIYCNKLWPKKQVMRSAENIFDEVQLYYHLGIRRFTIIDDIFNLNRKNSSRFFQLIIKNGLDLQLFFPNGLRGDLLTPDYIDLMVEAGVAGVAMALETASPRLQKLIKKNLHIDKLYKNLSYFCEKHPQVILELFTMHGFPSETKEEALLTLDFIKSLKWLHYPYVNILKVFPNTKMMELAIENGVSKKSIFDSTNLAYHELPDTLPFEKSFTKKYQMDFVNNYFLSKERLKHVLPHQLRLLSPEEIVKKFESYLPVSLKDFKSILEFVDITEEELGQPQYLKENHFAVPDLNKKLTHHFSQIEKDNLKTENALNILLLDLSQFFSDIDPGLYNMVEPPLGLMYLMTYLKKHLKGKIKGKIAKSNIDFDNYSELENLLKDFQPDVIGIRTLTHYNDFFHRTIAMCRHLGYSGPIITGGPYANSEYENILQDTHIDVVVLGEGEVTFAHLIKEIIKNNGKLPNDKVLKEIPGIAYIPEREKQEKSLWGDRKILIMDTMDANLTGTFSKADKINSLKPHAKHTLLKPNDPAYIIYTSGTSGKPKGVMIKHQNIVRLLTNENNNFDFHNKDIWTMFHSPGFDFSVWEMYGALLYGGRLVIIPETEIRDPKLFFRTLIREKITVLNQTPSAFYNLITFVDFKQIKKLYLKYIIFGGEILTPSKLKKWQNQYPEITLINMYGITETTVHVTYKEITAKDISLKQSNIGKPIPTLIVFLLDQYFKIVPIGVPGEIFVGGRGLSQGYLNRPELSIEKFIPIKEFLIEDFPFSSPLKKRMSHLYRSGDLARLLSCGDMEYLGRIDQQVKVKGYRIELGEIENALLENNHIKETVIHVKETDEGNKYLCAYFVPHQKDQESLQGDSGKMEFKVNDLRESLSKKLPDYMIPAHFISLEMIPLTPNGKIDYQSLPDPKKQSMDMAGDFVAPENEIEKELVRIWEKVLDRGKIGVKDNFFMLGGDSIKSIQIAARMKKAGYQFEMRDLFSYPTIVELAPLIKKIDINTDQSFVSGKIPLTPIQCQFFENIDIEPHHFNQAVMLYSAERIKEDLLRKVMDKILEHHDALRTTFHEENGRMIQVTHSLDYPLWLEVFDFTHMENATEPLVANANEIQASINLEKGPLMKIGLFRLQDGDRLLIVCHHLVIDGISWRILFEDIETLYKQVKNNDDLILPLKTDAFKIWAEKLYEYANSDLFLRETDYWENLESIAPAMLKQDSTGEDNRLDHLDTMSFSLSVEETEKLLTQINHAYGTEINDILLTGLCIGVRETFSCNHVMVALEGHGREGIIPGIDITRTVGWFTSVYPIVLNASFRNDMAKQIIEVKDTLRRIPNKGIGYGILKYLTDSKFKTTRETKLKPQISFNYLGQFDTDVKQMSFRVAQESAGISRSPKGKLDYELDITGILARKQLNISIAYNTTKFKPETIKKFSRLFKSELIRIISLCSKKEKREPTPGDFKFKELSMEDLDNIF